MGVMWEVESKGLVGKSLARAELKWRNMHFCDKRTRFKKGSKTCSTFTECVDLRTHNTIRKVSIATDDSRIVWLCLSWFARCWCLVPQSEESVNEKTARRGRLTHETSLLHFVRRCNTRYRINGSARWKYEANPMFRLATRAVKMGPWWPRFAAQEQNC